MSHIRYTRIPIEEMIFALAVDEWQLRLVPDDEHKELPVISLVYTNAHLLRSIGYLRGENKNGYHIYGRPITNRHILVDDLDQDALDQVRDDGLRPNVVVRTSKDNYQTWITTSGDEIEPNVASTAAKILAERYGGDSGSTDAQHLGRLPGFTNRKNIYWTEEGHYPFTGLHGKVRRGVSPGASKLLEDATDFAASLPSSPSAPGACAPITNLDIDPSRSPMTQEEARKIYEAELQYQAKRRGWPIPIRKGFRSQADYAVVYGLKVQYGYDPDDLAALLQYESEKAAERGMDYVIRTVNAALSNTFSTLTTQLLPKLATPWPVWPTRT
jgi:hypothetical protein